MSRICVIGDSHVGALKRAASALPPGEFGAAMTFFAGHVDLMRSLRAEGRTLVTPSKELRRLLAVSSRGAETIAVDDYDQFVVIGLQFGIRRLAALYRDYTSDSMTSRPDGKYLLSDACFVKAAEAAAAGSEAMRIARMLRALTDRPIIVVPVPNQAAGLDEAELPRHMATLFAAVRNGDADAIGALFARLCAELGRTVGVRIIPPLREVAENGLFNQRSFSLLPEDTSGLSLHRKLGLMAHGNELYGARILHAIQAAAA